MRYKASHSVLCFRYAGSLTARRDAPEWCDHIKKVSELNTFQAPRVARFFSRDALRI